jgi:UDP-N-acetylmuramoyl-L-alanyl-D-glutamate--2,6-diaminopimelate ligase
MMRLGDIVDLGNADEALAWREIDGIASDSRKVQPGYAFFALAGSKDDGLAHVGDALARGAAAIVAERETPIAGAPFVRVADARAALARAAAHMFPRQPATIVAVTGTSGKTSVAAFARQIWLSLGLEAASLGTIGVGPSTGWRTRASRIWRWRPRHTASTRSASTACVSPPAPSPI